MRPWLRMSDPGDPAPSWPGKKKKVQFPHAVRSVDPSSPNVIAPGPEMLSVTDVPVSVLVRVVYRAPWITIFVGLPSASVNVMEYSLFTGKSTWTRNGHGPSRSKGSAGTNSRVGAPAEAGDAIRSVMMPVRSKTNLLFMRSPPSLV